MLHYYRIKGSWELSCEAARKVVAWGLISVRLGLFFASGDPWDFYSLTRRVSGGRLMLHYYRIKGSWELSCEGARKVVAWGIIFVRLGLFFASGDHWHFYSLTRRVSGGRLMLHYYRIKGSWELSCEGARKVVA